VTCSVLVATNVPRTRSVVAKDGLVVHRTFTRPTGWGEEAVEEEGSGIGPEIAM